MRLRGCKTANSAMGIYRYKNEKINRNALNITIQILQHMVRCSVLAFGELVLA